MNEIFNTAGDFVSWIIVWKLLIVLVLIIFSLRSFWKTFNKVLTGDLDKGFPMESLTKTSVWILITIFTTLGLFFFFGTKPPTLNSMEEPAGHVKMVQEAKDAPTAGELKEVAEDQKPEVLKRQSDPGAGEEIEKVMKEVDQILK